MRPGDVDECVKIVAANQLLRVQYGNDLADLRAAWLCLLASNPFCGTAVFEEIEGSRTRIIGVGVTVFVSDDFLRELKTPPCFWIGPELTSRIKRGDSPLLTEGQVREANSRDGLNLVTWHASISPQDTGRMEVWNEVMAAFMKDHRGYRLKELVSHAECMVQAQGMRISGAKLWKAAGEGYSESWDDNLDNLLGNPHIIGLTRELARSGALSWINSLFFYQAPLCGFSRSEQRLLLAALDGGTDEELSDAMAISLDTVKKTWRLIYERAEACLPKLLPSALPTENGVPRGKGKKQLLLAYLREHWEELRPVSIKSLRENAQQCPSVLTGVTSNGVV